MFAVDSRQADKPNMSSKQAEKKITPRKVILMVLLTVANLFVANVVYNCWTAKRGTPLMVSVKSNVVSSLWRSWSKHKADRGIVSGIIADKSNPAAIINGRVRYEGDLIDGAEIVSISKTDVHFEKNGKAWTQQVGEPPNKAWQ
jgi:hypothetical protein